MQIFGSGKKYILYANLIALLFLVSPQKQANAMDPRFELDSSELTSATPSHRKVRVADRHNLTKKRGDESSEVIHTVRSGDNLFKILMRNYGLSNREAELCMEDIRRENNIYDIKRLKVGQKISIPNLRRKNDGSFKKIARSFAAETRQSLKLESPIPTLPEGEVLSRIRQTWEVMIPSAKEEQKPITLSSSTFSLTLDPKRYPVYPAMDGGKIVVDSTGSIPPLVKSLIMEKDPSIRIISESTGNNRSFIGSLLKSANFYSLEENYSMDFGTDPKLTVNADFKIEKNKNSLIQQDVTLVNSGRETMPQSIVNLLKKEGFSLHEPFASFKSYNLGQPKQFIQVTGKTQPEIVDSLLFALSVTPAVDRKMDVFAADNNGISLSVKAERYFDYSGKRFVLTRFDGDPITYTLFRILETKGYQVVILDTKDDFKKISEKMLAKMNLHTSYKQQTVVSGASHNYTLQMSGIMLNPDSKKSEGLFFTDLKIDKLLQDLLTENGYIVTTR